MTDNEQANVWSHKAMDNVQRPSSNVQRPSWNGRGGSPNRPGESEPDWQGQSPLPLNALRTAHASSGQACSCRRKRKAVLDYVGRTAILSLSCACEIPRFARG